MSESLADPTSPRQAFPDPIPGIIPFGSLVLFAGASGVGKTIMQVEWIKRWLDGRTICGHPTNKPTGIYYLAADRDWSTYAEAFACVGISEIPHYVLAEDMETDPRHWKEQSCNAFNLLNICLNKLAPIPGSIVFVDPIAPLFIHGDQNRPREVAMSMHWARRCAQVRQITLICNANVGKPRVDEEYRRPQDRIAGSGAFVAFTDTQIYMIDGAKPEDPRILGWTPRRAPAEEFQFQFDPATKLFVPFTGLKDEGETPENDRPTQLLQFIPEDGTPIEASDLVELAKEAFKVSKETVYRDLKVLIRRHRIVRNLYGQYQRRKVN